MNRNILIAGGFLAIVAVGAAAVRLTTHRPEWTTSSTAAMSEFQKGLDAREKLYYDEARQHFAKAIELDPGFVLAKYFLISSTEGQDDDSKTAGAIAELLKTDASRLTERERFLLAYSAATRNKDTGAAEKILSAYASAHPDDPYVLERQTSLATARQAWPEAHRLLTRTIEVAPNRVVAYNQLGYLEMGQGRFTDAQKMFETYRYIAPDQANPHDSLGELYILLGRYDEAKKELESALAIKPDFCASYEHLLRLALMQGRIDEAERTLARVKATAPCDATVGKGMRCLAAVWPPLFSADWEGVWKAQQAACPKIDGDPLQVWVLLRTGRSTEAEAFEKSARERLAKMAASEPGRGYVEAFVAHIEGARLLVDGEPAKAAERFRTADRLLSYRELPMALIKLTNRFVLARALEASGAHDEAASVLAAARAVNADYVNRLVVLPLAPAAS